MDPIFSDNQLNAMGVNALVRSDHFGEDAGKVSLSFVTRWLRKHDSEPISLSSVEVQNLFSTIFPNESKDTLDASRFKDLTYREMGLRLWNYLTRIGSHDHEDGPVHPDKAIGRRKRVPKPKAIYGMNRRALISRYLKYSLNDLLAIQIPQGLEEEHLEAVRAAIFKSLQDEKGKLRIDSRISRSTVPLDLQKIQQPVAVAAVMAVKDYLGEREGAKVYIEFVACQNTDQAETLIRDLAKKVEVDEEAIEVKV